MTLAGIRRIATFSAALCLAHPAMAEDPGQVFHITPDDLPAPFAEPSAVNPARKAPRPRTAPLKVPDGFSVNLFADRLQHARNIRVASDGTVFLAEPSAGRITVLKDTDSDGQSDIEEDYWRGLNRPHGLALRDGWLYFADLDHIWRMPWQPGQIQAGQPPERLTPDGALGDTGGHWTRNITFSADGRFLYAAIGSRSNLAEEPEPRATIQRFDVKADGTLGAQKTFARGLRNPVGIRVKPGTDTLYTVVNERDGMGDGLVPDYFTAVREDGFYGWPYAYIGSNPMPEISRKRPDLVKRTLVPDVLIRSHSAPLGLTFLAGADVPEDWKDDALVTLHGSWNAADATGYKVVRIPFEDGKPTGRYINFLTGFRLNPEEKGRAYVWGRPVGIDILPDGSILIADDVGQTVWRVSRGK